MAADDSTDDRRPELVLVHGLGSGASYWDNLLPLLAPEFHVRTVNLPGHGPRAQRVPANRAHPAALARTLVEGLTREGLVRSHLVGISLGGWVVLEMAVLGFARSVVSLAPAGLWQLGGIRQDRVERTARTAMLPVLGMVPLVARVPALRHIGLTPYCAHPEQVTADQFTKAAMALAEARGYGSIDRALVNHRFTDGLHVAVPVTVAFGDADRVLPEHSSRDLALLPPQTEVQTIASCGHAMTWDQPGACVELIRKAVVRGDAAG
jgi:pimeloyl-ACP methyl ester carboxylesterase